MTTTDTGPDQRTRQLIRERSGDCCELCGLWAVAGQVHHRRARAMGGTSDPATNWPSNLVLFCAMCHRYVETIQRASAYQYGWLVPQGKNPALWPFLLWGQWVLLTDSGGYLPAPDPDPDPAETERELF